MVVTCETWLSLCVGMLLVVVKWDFFKSKIINFFQRFESIYVKVSALQNFIHQFAGGYIEGNNKITKNLMLF